MLSLKFVIFYILKIWDFKEKYFYKFTITNVMKTYGKRDK